MLFSEITVDVVPYFVVSFMVRIMPFGRQVVKDQSHNKQNQSAAHNRRHHVPIAKIFNLRRTCDCN